MNERTNKRTNESINQSIKSINQISWGSKRAYHSITGPVSAGVRLTTTETEISAAQWALAALEELYFIKTFATREEL